LQVKWLRARRQIDNDGGLLLIGRRGSDKLRLAVGRWRLPGDEDRSWPRRGLREAIRQ
jgi:hypothetical protein